MLSALERRRFCVDDCKSVAEGRCDKIRIGQSELEVQAISPDEVETLPPRPGPAAPPAAPQMPLGELVGQTISRYEIGAVLAKGQTGVVFHARDKEADLPVALHPYQSVFFQAAKRHSDRGRRHRKPVGKGSRYDSLAFAFSGKNCLQIIFFGNRDH